MRRFLPILSIIVALAGSTAIYYSSEVFFLEPRGFFSPAAKIAIRSVMLAVLTSLGIFCGTIYSALQSRKSERVNIKVVIRSLSTSRQFWMAIFFAPIVLTAVFKGAEQIPDDFVAYAFAFENGFFVKTLMEKTKP